MAPVAPGVPVAPVAPVGPVGTDVPMVTVLAVVLTVTFGPDARVTPPVIEFTDVTSPTVG